MKKSILILTTLFFVSGTLSAQKKPTQKSVTQKRKNMKTEKLDFWISSYIWTFSYPKIG